MTAAWRSAGDEAGLLTGSALPAAGDRGPAAMPRLHLCRRAGTGVPGPRGHRRAGGEVRAGRARGRRARLLWPPERLGPGPLSEKAPPAPHPLFSRRRLSPLLSPSPGSSARPAGARRQQEHAAAAAARAERAARGEGGARAAARRGGRRGGRASAGEAQPARTLAARSPDPEGPRHKRGGRGAGHPQSPELPGSPRAPPSAPSWHWRGQAAPRRTPGLSPPLPRPRKY